MEVAFAPYRGWPGAIAVPSRNGPTSLSYGVQSIVALSPLNDARGGNIDPLWTLNRCHSAALRYRLVNRTTSLSFVYLPRCCRTAVRPFNPKLFGRVEVDGKSKFHTSSFTGIVVSRLPLLVTATSPRYIPALVDGGTYTSIQIG